jgi:hypothetical protein
VTQGLAEKAIIQDALLFVRPLLHFLMIRPALPRQVPQCAKDAFPMISTVLQLQLLKMIAASCKKAVGRGTNLDWVRTR